MRFSKLIGMAACLWLAACSSPPSTEKVAAIGGGIAGGVAGSFLGNGAGQIAAATGGTILGTLGGAEVGNTLSDDPPMPWPPEEDRGYVVYHNTPNLPPGCHRETASMVFGGQWKRRYFVTGTWCPNGTPEGVWYWDD